MRESRLDPVRWPRLPRGRTMLRTALVAALLLTAAGALYAQEPASCPAVTASPESPTPDADGRLTVPAGSVGVPVRLAEPSVLSLIRPGDRVDLLAVSGAAATDPTQVASDVLVLAVAGAEGALVLALRRDQARKAVGLPEGARFGVVVRP